MNSKELLSALKSHVKERLELGEKQYLDLGARFSRTPAVPRLPQTHSALSGLSLAGISNIKDFGRSICECQKCPLGKTRNKFVFGEGNP